MLDLFAGVAEVEAGSDDERLLATTKSVHTVLVAITVIAGVFGGLINEAVAFPLSFLCFYVGAGVEVFLRRDCPRGGLQVALGLVVGLVWVLCSLPLHHAFSNDSVRDNCAGSDTSPIG